MSGAAWGGSEELWSETAFKALQVGHEVFVSVVGWANKAPKLRELERRGAKILRRYNRDFPAQGGSFVAASSYRDLFKMNPDVLVINQASSFEVIERPDLLELLYVTPIPFVLVCHWNQNLPILVDDCRREHASNIFSRAFRVLFVSNQNRIEAERQLAMKISNSDLVLNPVNLSDRSYFPWPDSRTARLASVARLTTWSKGQDILIEALSADQWKERDWHLTIYGSGPDESYLRSLVEFLGLQGRITFAGHQNDVRAIWAEEQVLVMFSRAEGTPMALVQSWNAMGMQAHKFATARIRGSSIPGLLDVLLEAWRHKRPAGAATSEEPERLKLYRRLLKPTIGRQAKRIAKAGALPLKNILARWRAARERSLLQLAKPRKPY